MNRFLAGGCACVALFALSSSASWSGRADGLRPIVRQQVGAIRLADLPLNRSFNTLLPLALTSSNPPTFGASLAFPPAAGVALTHVTVPLTSVNSFGELSLSVDGAVVARRNPISLSGMVNLDFDFSPPIVVPPGGTLSLSHVSGQSITPYSVSLSGWTLAPGDV